jgi:hypothetical protein
MRHLVLLVIVLAAGPASAQTEAESAWNEVQERAAEALASQDCRVACRALESLQRATKRLCDIGPEHCEEARAKLRDATERVRTTCPECEVKAVQSTSKPPPAPPQYGGGADKTVAREEAAPAKSGGCAGCNTAAGARGSIGLAILVLLALRRKKKGRV